MEQLEEESGTPARRNTLGRLLEKLKPGSKGRILTCNHPGVISRQSCNEASKEWAGHSVATCAQVSARAAEQVSFWSAAWT